MEEFTSCTKCEYQTPDLTANFCAVCGGKMLTSARVRKLGWMSVVAGGVIVVILAGTAFALRFSNATWEGTTAFAIYGITLGILILAIGVVGIIAGVWQIRNGRRHKMLVYTMMGLASVLVALIAIHELTDHSSP